MRGARCLAAAALVLGGCASPDGDLAGLARQRLALAPEVAWFKHSGGIPVYDASRENALIASVVAEGRSAGLDSEAVRRFFSAEMEASRRIQWEWIHAWNKGWATPARDPLDLASDLRPRIDDINRRQIAALALGAQPLTIAQLSALGERFLPKKSLSRAAASFAITPPVNSQR